MKLSRWCIVGVLLALAAGYVVAWKLCAPQVGGSPTPALPKFHWPIHTYASDTPESHQIFC